VSRPLPRAEFRRAKTKQFSGAVEIATIMGDDAMPGVTLTAVDEQLPPEQTPPMPPR
jgi:hypothetical protein